MALFSAARAGTLFCRFIYGADATSRRILYSVVENRAMFDRGGWIIRDSISRKIDAKGSESRARKPEELRSLRISSSNRRESEERSGREFANLPSANRR